VREHLQPSGGRAETALPIKFAATIEEAGASPLQYD
jgi:hypothetical protein